jgi:hypothetical protein
MTSRTKLLIGPDASIGQGGFCRGVAFGAAAKAIHAMADTRDWDDRNYAA